MDPSLLHDLTYAALVAAGTPQWASPLSPDHPDELRYVEGAYEDAQWGLVSLDPAQADFLPVSGTMARDLICTHLRCWLANRGWQVQVRLRKQRLEWRLADCLHFTEGGGTRLEADYPSGEDELEVLCASVEAIAGASPVRRHLLHPAAC